MRDFPQLDPLHAVQKSKRVCTCQATAVVHCIQVKSQKSSKNARETETEKSACFSVFFVLLLLASQAWFLFGFFLLLRRPIPIGLILLCSSCSRLATVVDSTITPTARQKPAGTEPRAPSPDALVVSLGTVPDMQQPSHVLGSRSSPRKNTKYSRICGTE